MYARVRVGVRVLHVGGVQCDLLTHRIDFCMTVSYSWFFGVYFDAFFVCVSRDMFALLGLVWI